MGTPVFVRLFDIKAFFDKESTRDVMNTLYEVNVDPKLYRTYYLLNKNTSIRVETGNGLSEEKDVGEIVAQGSGGAALVSQVNLDRGINEMFCGSENNVTYGAVRLQPLTFQDNIVRLSLGIGNLKAGTSKLDTVIKLKKLMYHDDKTGVIVMGDETKVRRAKLLLTRSPVMCGDFQVGVKTTDKYLGDMLDERGLGHSVTTTILKQIVYSVDSSTPRST